MGGEGRFPGLRAELLTGSAGAAAAAAGLGFAAARGLGAGAPGAAGAPAAAAEAVLAAWAGGAQLVVVHAVGALSAPPEGGGGSAEEVARWAAAVRGALEAAAPAGTLLYVALSPPAGDAPSGGEGEPGGADLGRAFPGFEGVRRPVQSFERLGAEGGPEGGLLGGGAPACSSSSGGRGSCGRTAAGGRSARPWRLISSGALPSPWARRRSTALDCDVRVQGAGGVNVPCGPHEGAHH